MKIKNIYYLKLKLYEYNGKIDLNFYKIFLFFKMINLGMSKWECRLLLLIDGGLLFYCFILVLVFIFIRWDGLCYL